MHLLKTYTATATDIALVLNWDLGTEADLSHYRIYRGTEPEPNTVIDSVDVPWTRDDVPQVTYTDTDVQEEVTHYYRITAVDTDGNESGFSNEVSGFYNIIITISVPQDYSTIQAGIDIAYEGDTVLVAAGTYVENINYNGKNIVLGSLYLTTQDTSYISSTIIDGNEDGSVVTFESGEDSTAVFERIYNSKWWVHIIWWRNIFK